MNNQFYTERSSEIRLFIILAAVLLLMLFTSFIMGSKVQREDISIPTEVVSIPFPPVVLGAKAVYVYDVRTQTVMFARNENVRLPLASLTKVMTALLSEDLSPLYGTVTISAEALAADGDSGLIMGERWSLKNLLDFSLITSSNDGMRAVALSFGALSNAALSPQEIINDFVVKMNVKAGELGLKNTYYWNETGLDESEVKGGAYGTAKDMNDLMEYILANYPELFLATRESTALVDSLDNNSHVAKNTNTIVAEIPGLLASKTGFTNTAGGNLVFVFDPELGRPIIVTILGSTEKGRFNDARTLVAAIMEYIEEH